MQPDSIYVTLHIYVWYIFIYYSTHILNLLITKKRKKNIRCIPNGVTSRIENEEMCIRGVVMMVCGRNKFPKHRQNVKYIYCICLHIVYVCCAFSLCKYRLSLYVYIDDSVSVNSISFTLWSYTNMYTYIHILRCVRRLRSSTIHCTTTHWYICFVCKKRVSTIFPLVFYAVCMYLFVKGRIHL